MRRSIGSVITALVVAFGVSAAVAETASGANDVAVGALGPAGPTIGVPDCETARSARAQPVDAGGGGARGPLGPAGPTIGTDDSAESDQDGALGPAGPTGASVGGVAAGVESCAETGELGPAGPTGGP